MKNHKLELSVFISGAVVMMLEMAGSRVLAPYLGNSTFVWTALIGIILGCLSLGYYLGGRYADKKATEEKYSNILLISAALILLSTVLKEPVLNWIVGITSDVRVGAVIATIILYAIPGIMLGMVSPYALKLKLKSLKTTGRTAGNLYALSTIGSIVGTFLSGFVLLSFMGHSNLLLSLAIVQTANALLIDHKKLLSIKLIIIAIVGGYIYHADQAEAKSDIISLDTQYSHVQIYEDKYWKDQRDILRLVRNTNKSSAMYIDTEENELVFQYTKFYDLVEHFVPNFKETLLIGGGAYSYPKHFLEKFPDANIDVVEIDPELFELAKEYFNLEPNEHFQNFAEDGRTYLNRNTKKYDAIFLDAFGGYHGIPAHLTTIETVELIYDSLNEGGVMIANTISSLEGEKSEFLRAEYHTYKKIFPQVYVLPVSAPQNTEIVQNQMLIAIKSETEPTWSSPNKYYNTYLSHKFEGELPNDLPTLTDDFAPVDSYVMKML